MEKIDSKLIIKMTCSEWWQNGGAKSFWCGLCSIGILLTVILIPLSIFDVEQEEYALKYDGLTKNLDNKVYDEGKYLFTPETELFIYNKIVVTIELKDLVCLASDGVQITMNIDYQYQLIRDELLQ